MEGSRKSARDSHRQLRQTPSSKTNPKNKYKRTVSLPPRESNSELPSGSSNVNTKAVPIREAKNFETKFSSRELVSRLTSLTTSHRTKTRPTSRGQEIEPTNTYRSAPFPLDLTECLQDASVWEALEIRFLENNKCTVLRPKLCSTVPNEEAGGLPSTTVTINKPTELIYKKSSLPDYHGEVRRQTVCVEKVHVRNLLNTKREKCGNLSSSRLSEYKPPKVNQIVQGACAEENGKDPRATDSWSEEERTCPTDTDSESCESEEKSDEEEDSQLHEQADRRLKEQADRKLHEQADRRLKEQVDRKLQEQAERRICLLSDNQLREQGDTRFCELNEREKNSDDDTEDDDAEYEDDDVDHEDSSEVDSSEEVDDDGEDEDDEENSADQDERRYSHDSPPVDDLGSNITSSQGYEHSQKRDAGSQSFRAKVSEAGTMRSNAGATDTVSTAHHETSDKAQMSLNQTANIKSSQSQGILKINPSLAAQWTKLPGQDQQPVTNETLITSSTSSSIERTKPSECQTVAELKCPASEDVSVRFDRTKSSISSFTPLTDVEISKYKEIALQILMERKKGEIKLSESSKKTEKREKKKREGPRISRDVTAQRPVSIGRGKSSNSDFSTSGCERNVFWTTRRIQNQIDKHKQRFKKEKLAVDGNVKSKKSKMENKRSRSSIQIRKSKEDALSSDAQCVSVGRKRNRSKDSLLCFTSDASNAGNRRGFMTGKSHSSIVTRGEMIGKRPLKEASALKGLESSSTKKKATSFLGFGKTKEWRLKKELSHPNLPWKLKEEQSQLSFTEKIDESNLHCKIAVNPNGHKFHEKENRGNCEKKLKFADKDEKCSARDDKYNSLDDKYNSLDDKYNSYNNQPKQPFSVAQKHESNQTLASPKFKQKTQKPGGVSAIVHKQHTTQKPADVDATGRAFEHVRDSAIQTNLSREQINTEIPAPPLGQQNQHQTSTGYLKLLQNILKSPTARASQALGMFLQKPDALASAERDLDITVDQIISSYREIFNELHTMTTCGEPMAQRPWGGASTSVCTDVYNNLMLEMASKQKWPFPDVSKLGPACQKCSVNQAIPIKEKSQILASASKTVNLTVRKNQNQQDGDSINHVFKAAPSFVEENHEEDKVKAATAEIWEPEAKIMRRFPSAPSAPAIRAPLNRRFIRSQLLRKASTSKTPMYSSPSFTAAKKKQSTDTEPQKINGCISPRVQRQTSEIKHASSTDQIKPDLKQSLKVTANNKTRLNTLQSTLFNMLHRMPVKASPDTFTENALVAAQMLKEMDSSATNKTLEQDRKVSVAKRAKSLSVMPYIVHITKSPKSVARSLSPREGKSKTEDRKDVKTPPYETKAYQKKANSKQVLTKGFRPDAPGTIRKNAQLNQIIPKVPPLSDGHKARGIRLKSVSDSTIPLKRPPVFEQNKAPEHARTSSKSFTAPVPNNGMVLDMAKRSTSEVWPPGDQGYIKYTGTANSSDYIPPRYKPVRKSFSASAAFNQTASITDSHRPPTRETFKIDKASLAASMSSPSSVRSSNSPVSPHSAQSKTSGLKVAPVPPKNSPAPGCRPSKQSRSRNYLPSQQSSKPLAFDRAGRRALKKIPSGIELQSEPTKSSRSSTFNLTSPKSQSLQGSYLKRNQASNFKFGSPKDERNHPKPARRSQSEEPKKGNFRSCARNLEPGKSPVRFDVERNERLVSTHANKGGRPYRSDTGRHCRSEECVGTFKHIVRETLSTNIGHRGEKSSTSSLDSQDNEGEQCGTPCNMRVDCPPKFVTHDCQPLASESNGLHLLKSSIPVPRNVGSCKPAATRQTNKTDSLTGTALKQHFSEDDSETSDGVSLHSLRKHAVARTCQMIIQESKNLIVNRELADKMHEVECGTSSSNNKLKQQPFQHSDSSSVSKISLLKLNLLEPSERKSDTVCDLSISLRNKFDEAHPDIRSSSILNLESKAVTDEDASECMQFLKSDNPTQLHDSQLTIRQRELPLFQPAKVEPAKVEPAKVELVKVTPSKITGLNSDDPLHHLEDDGNHVSHWSSYVTVDEVCLQSKKYPNSRSPTSKENSPPDVVLSSKRQSPPLEKSGGQTNHPLSEELTDRLIFQPGSIRTAINDHTAAQTHTLAADNSTFPPGLDGACPRPGLSEKLTHPPVLHATSSSDQRNVQARNTLKDGALEVSVENSDMESDLRGQEDVLSILFSESDPSHENFKNKDGEIKKPEGTNMREGFQVKRTVDGESSNVSIHGHLSSTRSQSNENSQATESPKSEKLDAKPFFRRENTLLASSVESLMPENKEWSGCILASIPTNIRQNVMSCMDKLNLERRDGKVLTKRIVDINEQPKTFLPPTRGHSGAPEFTTPDNNLHLVSLETIANFPSEDSQLKIQLSMTQIVKASPNAEGNSLTPADRDETQYMTGEQDTAKDVSSKHSFNIEHRFVIRRTPSENAVSKVPENEMLQHLEVPDIEIPRQLDTGDNVKVFLPIAVPEVSEMPEKTNSISVDLTHEKPSSCVSVQIEHALQTREICSNADSAPATTREICSNADTAPATFKSSSMEQQSYSFGNNDSFSAESSGLDNSVQCLPIRKCEKTQSLMPNFQTAQDNVPRQLPYGLQPGERHFSERENAGYCRAHGGFNNAREAGVFQAGNHEAGVHERCRCFCHAAREHHGCLCPMAVQREDGALPYIQRQCDMALPYVTIPYDTPLPYVHRPYDAALPYVHRPSEASLPFVNRQYDASPPFVNRQYDASLPFVNRQYDESLPFVNRQYDPSLQFANRQYDASLPFVNRQYDPSLPFANRQYDAAQPFANRQSTSPIDKKLMYPSSIDEILNYPRTEGFHESPCEPHRDERPLGHEEQVDGRAFTFHGRCPSSYRTYIHPSESQQTASQKLCQALKEFMTDQRQKLSKEVHDSTEVGPSQPTLNRKQETTPEPDEICLEPPLPLSIASNASTKSPKDYNSPCSRLAWDVNNRDETSDVNIVGLQHPCGVTSDGNIVGLQYPCGVTSDGNIVGLQYPCGVISDRNIVGLQDPCGVISDGNIVGLQDPCGVISDGNIVDLQHPCGVISYGNTVDLQYPCDEYTADHSIDKLHTMGDVPTLLQKIPTELLTGLSRSKLTISEDIRTDRCPSGQCSEGPTSSMEESTTPSLSDEQVNKENTEHLELKTQQNCVENVLNDNFKIANQDLDTTDRNNKSCLEIENMGVSYNIREESADDDGDDDDETAVHKHEATSSMIPQQDILQLRVQLDIEGVVESCHEMLLQETQQETRRETLQETRQETMQEILQEAMIETLQETPCKVQFSQVVSPQELLHENNLEQTPSTHLTSRQESLHGSVQGSVQGSVHENLGQKTPSRLGIQQGSVHGTLQGSTHENLGQKTPSQLELSQRSVQGSTHENLRQKTPSQLELSQRSVHENLGQKTPSQLELSQRSVHGTLQGSTHDNLGLKTSQLGLTQGSVQGSVHKNLEQTTESPLESAQQMLIPHESHDKEILLTVSSGENTRVTNAKFQEQMSSGMQTNQPDTDTHASKSCMANADKVNQLSVNKVSSEVSEQPIVASQFTGVVVEHEQNDHDTLKIPESQKETKKENGSRQNIIKVSPDISHGNSNDQTKQETTGIADVCQDQINASLTSEQERNAKNKPTTVGESQKMASQIRVQAKPDKSKQDQSKVNAVENKTQQTRVLSRQRVVDYSHIQQKADENLEMFLNSVARIKTHSRFSSPPTKPGSKNSIQYSWINSTRTTSLKTTEFRSLVSYGIEYIDDASILSVARSAQTSSSTGDQTLGDSLGMFSPLRNRQTEPALGPHTPFSLIEVNEDVSLVTDPARSMVELMGGSFTVQGNIDKEHQSRNNTSFTSHFTQNSNKACSSRRQISSIKSHSKKGAEKKRKLISSRQAQNPQSMFNESIFKNMPNTSSLNPHSINMFNTPEQSGYQHYPERAHYSPVMGANFGINDTLSTSSNFWFNRVRSNPFASLISNPFIGHNLCNSFNDARSMLSRQSTDSREVNVNLRNLSPLSVNFCGQQPYVAREARPPCCNIASPVTMAINFWSTFSHQSQESITRGNPICSHSTVYNPLEARAASPMSKKCDSPEHQCKDGTRYVLTAEDILALLGRDEAENSDTFKSDLQKTSRSGQTEEYLMLFSEMVPKSRPGKNCTENVRANWHQQSRSSSARNDETIRRTESDVLDNFSKSHSMEHSMMNNNISCRQKGALAASSSMPDITTSELPQLWSSSKNTLDSLQQSRNKTPHKRRNTDSLQQSQNKTPHKRRNTGALKVKRKRRWCRDNSSWLVKKRKKNNQLFSKYFQWITSSPLKSHIAKVRKRYNLFDTDCESGDSVKADMTEKTLGMDPKASTVSSECSLTVSSQCICSETPLLPRLARTPGNRNLPSPTLGTTRSTPHFTRSSQQCTRSSGPENATGSDMSEYLCSFSKDPNPLFFDTMKMLTSKFLEVFFGTKKKLGKKNWQTLKSGKFCKQQLTSSSSGRRKKNPHVSKPYRGRKCLNSAKRKKGMKPPRYFLHKCYSQLTLSYDSTAESEASAQTTLMGSRKLRNIYKTQSNTQISSSRISKTEISRKNKKDVSSHNDSDTTHLSLSPIFISLAESTSAATSENEKRNPVTQEKMVQVVCSDFSCQNQPDTESLGSVLGQNSTDTLVLRDPGEILKNGADFTFEVYPNFMMSRNVTDHYMSVIPYIETVFIFLGGEMSDMKPAASRCSEALDVDLDTMLELIGNDLTPTIEDVEEMPRIKTKGAKAIEQENTEQEPDFDDEIDDDFEMDKVESLMKSHVYQTRIYEQDYDGDIHEVIFLTKDTGDPRAEDQSTDGRQHELGQAAHAQLHSVVDESVAWLYQCRLAREGDAQSPPKARAPCRGYLSSHMSTLKSPYRHVQGGDSIKLSPSTRKERHSSMKKRSKITRKLKNRKLDLDSNVYRNPVDFKTGSPDLNKLSGSKRHHYKGLQQGVNVFNRTYTHLGQDDRFNLNLLLDSSPLSEMQTEFNEEIESMSGKHKTDNQYLTDDYELDTYEELGSFFTEMQESSSSKIYLDDVVYENSQSFVFGNELISASSDDVTACEYQDAQDYGWQKTRTLSTMSSTTPTHYTLEEYESTDTSDAPGRKGKKHNSWRSNKKNPKPHSSDSMKDAEVNVSKEHMILHPVPTLATCCTQTDGSAEQLISDLSLVKNDSSACAHLGEFMSKCIKSSNFKYYLQRVVDERLNKRLNEIRFESRETMLPSTGPSRSPTVKCEQSELTSSKILIDPEVDFDMPTPMCDVSEDNLDNDINNITAQIKWPLTDRSLVICSDERRGITSAGKSNIGKDTHHFFQKHSSSCLQSYETNEGNTYVQFSIPSQKSMYYTTENTKPSRDEQHIEASGRSHTDDYLTTQLASQTLKSFSEFNKTQRDFGKSLSTVPRQDRLFSGSSLKPEELALCTTDANLASAQTIDEIGTSIARSESRLRADSPIRPASQLSINSYQMLCSEKQTYIQYTEEPIPIYRNSSTNKSSSHLMSQISGKSEAKSSEEVILEYSPQENKKERPCPGINGCFSRKCASDSSNQSCNKNILLATVNQAYAEDNIQEGKLDAGRKTTGGDTSNENLTGAYQNEKELNFGQAVARRMNQKLKNIKSKHKGLKLSSEPSHGKTQKVRDICQLKTVLSSADNRQMAKRQGKKKRNTHKKCDEQASNTHALAKGSENIKNTYLLKSSGKLGQLKPKQEQEQHIEKPNITNKSDGVHVDSTISANIPLDDPLAQSDVRPAKNDSPLKEVESDEKIKTSAEKDTGVNITKCLVSNTSTNVREYHCGATNVREYLGGGTNVREYHGGGTNVCEYLGGGTNVRAEYQSGSTPVNKEYPSGGTNVHGEFPSGGTKVREQYYCGGLNVRGEYLGVGTHVREEYPSVGSNEREEYHSGGTNVHGEYSGSGSNVRREYPSNGLNVRGDNPGVGTIVRREHPSGGICLTESISYTKTKFEMDNLFNVGNETHNSLEPSPAKDDAKDRHEMKSSNLLTESQLKEMKYHLEYKLSSSPVKEVIPFRLPNVVEASPEVTSSKATPDTNFHAERESATPIDNMSETLAHKFSASGARVHTPSGFDPKSCESSGTLTNTSVDYGRLKNVLSAETKILWKSLTRLEKNCDSCTSCRLKYLSMLSPRLNIDENEFAAHLTRDLNSLKENIESCQCCHSQRKKQMSSNDKPKDGEEKIDVAPANANTDAVEVNTPCNESAKKSSLQDEALQDRIQLRKTGFVRGRNTARMVQLFENAACSPEDEAARAAKPEGNNSAPSPVAVGTVKGSRLRFPVWDATSTIGLSGWSPPKLKKDSEAFQLFQRKLDNTNDVDGSSQAGSDAFVLPPNLRPLEGSPLGKTTCEETAKMHATADAWIERLVNILHEMHQTFPRKVTQSQSCPSKDTKSFRDCKDNINLEYHQESALASNTTVNDHELGEPPPNPNDHVLGEPPPNRTDNVLGEPPPNTNDALTQAPKQKSPTKSPVQIHQPTRVEIKFGIQPKADSSKVLNDKRFSPLKISFIAKKQSDHDKDSSEHPSLPCEKNVGSDEPKISVSRNGKSEDNDLLKRLTNDDNPPRDASYVKQEDNSRHMSSSRSVPGQGQPLAQTNDDKGTAQARGNYFKQGESSLDHRSDVASLVDIANREPEVRISNTATHQTMDEFRKVAHQNNIEVKTSPHSSDSHANNCRETIQTSLRSRQVVCAGPENFSREFRTVISAGTASESSSNLPAQTRELSSKLSAKIVELSSKLSAKVDELNSKPVVEKEEFSSKLSKLRELTSKLPVKKEDLSSKLLSKTRELSSKLPVEKEELSSKLYAKPDELHSKLAVEKEVLNSNLADETDKLSSKLPSKTDKRNLKEAVEKEKLSSKPAATPGDLSSKFTAPTNTLSAKLPTATSELRSTPTYHRIPTSATAAQGGNSHELSTIPAHQNKPNQTEDGTYFIQDTFSGFVDREKDNPNSDVSKRDASRSHRIDSDISNQTICVSSEPFHSLWAVPSLSSSLVSHHKVNIQASFFSKKISERCLRMKSNVVDRTEQCKLNLKRKYYTPSVKYPDQTPCRRCHSLPELRNNHLDKSFNAPVSFDDTSLKLTLKSKTCLDFSNFQRGNSHNKSIRIQKQSLHTRFGKENALPLKKDKQYSKVNKLEDYLLAEELKQQNGLTMAYSRLRLERDQTSSPSSTTDLDLNYQCQTKFVADAIKSLEQRTKRKLDHFRRNSSDDSSLDDSETATTNTLSSRRTSLCNNSSAFIRQDACPSSLFSSRRLYHNSPRESPPQPVEHQLREISPSSTCTQGKATGNSSAQISTTQACCYQVNHNHRASCFGHKELTQQKPVHVDSSSIGSSSQSDKITPLLASGGSKSSYDKRRFTEASTKEMTFSTTVKRSEEGTSKTTKVNVSKALEIPVDIYTVPLWRPLKDEQSQKKSKKKKDGVATRTVVISGPLSNFTIPVKRHFKEQLAATADDAGVRLVEVDSAVPAAKDAAPPAPPALHASLPATESADDQKRGWIGKVRKILPFRKKEKSPKKK